MLILLLAVAILALLSFSQHFNQKSEGDARKAFNEDLDRNYPDADSLNIYGITKIGDGADSYYLLKAWVSYNRTTPCPRLMEVNYYYPTQSYLRREQDIVNNCRVCPGQPHCVILYAEEAIIISHTYAGGEQVKAFIDSNPAAKASVVLLPVWTNSVSSQSADWVERANVWQVDWKEPATKEGLSVFISQGENRILAVWPLPPG